MALSRRNFNISAAALTALAANTFAAEEKEAKKPRLRKAVKYGMIGDNKQKVSMSPEEKLELEDYLKLEHLLVLAKAKARLSSGHGG